MGFLFYWVFDNLGILSAVKVLHYDPKKMVKIGSYAWSIALYFGLIKNILELYKLVLAQNSDKEKKSYSMQILAKSLEIIGKLGDLLVSVNGTGIPLMLTGKGINEGVIGAGGFVSAVVALYLQWK